MFIECENRNSEVVTVWTTNIVYRGPKGKDSASANRPVICITVQGASVFVKKM